jgi:hypothetical protein
MAFIEFMDTNSSAAALIRQQRRCLERNNSGANVSAMEEEERKKLRKSNVTAIHIAEAKRLHTLWTNREANKELSQQDFGEQFEIGGQSAVGQFLRGESPLSLKAAKGFALGLNCTIDEFSQRLAAEAAQLGQLAGTPTGGAPDLTSLNKLELQLIEMYRGLGPDQQNEVMQLASKRYAAAHPDRSAAEPDDLDQDWLTRPRRGSK